MRFFKFYKYFTLKMFEFLCIKLRLHIGLKLTFVFCFFALTPVWRLKIDWNDFLGGKMLFWSFFMTKMRFFKFFKKSINLFWFFSVMLQQHKRLQILSCFYWEKIFTGFFNKNIPKMIFLSFRTNWCIGFFWCFTWSYSSIKAEKLVKLFCQNSCFEVFGARRP